MPSDHVSVDGVPGQPRPAATVILLRDTFAGIETYLLRRAPTMAFAPRMHVFPGGRLDAADFDQPCPLDVAALKQMALRGSTDPRTMAALYACAVRETAEEADVRVNSLVLFDHWVTPERDSRRYDVRFFLATLPAGQVATLVTTEAVHAAWWRPADAIALFEAGDLAMLPPTEAVLRYLSDFDSAAAVLAHGNTVPMQPKLPRRQPDGTWQLVHAYDGSVLEQVIDAPHTREDTGRP